MSCRNCENGGHPDFCSATCPGRQSVPPTPSLLLCEVCGGWLSPEGHCGNPDCTRCDMASLGAELERLEVSDPEIAAAGAEVDRVAAELLEDGGEA